MKKSSEEQVKKGSIVSVVRFLSIIVYIFFLVIPENILSVQLGSDSSISCTPSFISIVPYSVFPNTDTNNAMLTFGFFKNGFGLQDATTSCTFSSIFPVSGDISLHGGSLFLGTDFICQNRTRLITPGTIFGKNHILDLSQSVTGIPANFQLRLDNLSLFLNDDLVISGIVKITGTCLIDGRSNTIKLNRGTQIIVGANASLELRNIFFTGVQVNNIQCLTDSGSITLNNSTLKLSRDYTFSHGSILFEGETTLTGTSQFIYTTAMTSSIAKDSTLIIDQKMTFSYNSINQEPDSLNFLSATSAIFFDKNSTLYVGPGGLSLTNGHAIFNNKVSIFVEDTALSSTVGLSIGDNIKHDDMGFDILSGSVVSLKSGIMTYRNVNRSSLDMSTDASILRIEAGTTLQLDQTLYLGNGILQFSGGATLSNAPGTTIIGSTSIF